MPLTESNQYGATYEFGSPADADAPTIAGMKVRKVQLKFDPQVMETSPSPEGSVESVTVSKPEKRKWTGTFTGPVSNSATLATTADFTWNNRFWIVTSPGSNKDAGKYGEGSLEAVSYPGVTAPEQQQGG